MKIIIKVLSGLFALVLITTGGEAIAQEEQAAEEQQVLKGMENNMFAEDNETCFICHGEATFELNDTVLGVTEKRHMCQDYFVDRDNYYRSNHWSFACTDCHSPEFSIFPHQTMDRLEEHFACNDCHAYDEAYAHYQFEDIDVEYQESAHADLLGFSCWKCHDPHSYEINLRNSENLEETILYDNNICLECHGNFRNYELLTNHEEVNVVTNHEWLPNESLHFKNVRCIECHTEINEDILIAHKILPKEEAVKRCAECHSEDSRLMVTLYKHQSKQFRNDAGYINSVILNQSYVVGANPNKILNWLSFLIFGGMIAVILFHIAIRIIKKV